MDDEVIGKEELQMIKEQMTEDQGELQMTEELNRVVAVVRAATAPPLTSEEARQQAQAEGLVLRKGGNKAGYSGVGFDQRSGRSKPYQAYVRRIGKQVKLGSFATAEEAALCVARSPDPEEQVAAERAATAPREEARQQAQAEGLVLMRKGDNKAGYIGVGLDQRSGRSKPYQAYVRRGGKQVKLGSFATAEEAALCVARSPDGRATTERAAAAAVNMACLIVASGHARGANNWGPAR